MRIPLLDLIYSNAARCTIAAGAGSVASATPLYERGDLGATRWTQEDTAAQIGIGWRRLQDIEAGSVNLTLWTLVRVAKAFKVDVQDLFAPGSRQPRASHG